MTPLRNVATKLEGLRHPFDEARIAHAVREMLLGLGEDPDRDGLTDTPQRVARAYHEIFWSQRRSAGCSRPTRPYARRPSICCGVVEPMTNHRLANHEAIAAAKAGASHGIRVNCVAPGLVRTPLTARLTASAAGLKTFSALHPLGRVGEPEEVASALAWQIIGIDGALETVRPRVST